MEPTIVPRPEYDAIVEAAQPRDAELLEARQFVMQSLLTAPALTVAELSSTYLSAQGIGAEQGRQVPYDIPAGAGAEGIDRDAEPIRRQRLTFAVKLALAELAADGVIVPAEARGNDYLSIPVRRMDTSGAERVPVASPRIENAYRVTPGKRTFSEPPLFDAQEFLQGLQGLLDDRGQRCLDEALRAARSGLYLSAVNLLGAVSESAWYGIGRRFEGSDPNLARFIAEGQTAQVQRVVAGRLESVRRYRTTVSELRAHAAYLRDLRNYGAHPAEDHDPGLEQAFTETGCLLLTMQTHRYLARLREVAAAVE